MARYRIVVECSGVPTDAGLQGAADITRNFSKRPCHPVADCAWDGAMLRLTAENDFDAKGLALQDEFSDEISACITGGFDGDLRVVSVTVLEEPA